MKTFKLQCEILSPLHIGTGKEIEPLDYIITGERLYRLSFEKFVTDMTESERLAFEGILDKGNLLETRKYVEKHINVERNTLYSTEASPQIKNLYNTKKGDIQNQLLIYPFIRTEGDCVPIVPGSSIKGAMRTAVISKLAADSGLPKPRDFREEDTFEATVLGYKDGRNDPFRGIKTRDVALESSAITIRDVKNVARRNGKLQANDMQIICEVSHSWISGKCIEFEAELSFDESLFSTGFLSKTLDMDFIKKSCLHFYMEKMEKEHEKFYKNSALEKYSNQLLCTSLEKNSFLLRVGRFSGVESVTLDNYRNPKPPGNKMVWGRSRNLAEEKYPMGWVKVTVCE